MYKLQSQALETKMQQLVDGDRSSPPPTVPASTAPSPPNSPNTPPR
jgi:hypothetical protein